MNKFFILCLVVPLLGSCKKKAQETEAQRAAPQKQGAIDQAVESIKSLDDKVERAQDAQALANQDAAKKAAAAKELSEIE